MRILMTNDTTEWLDTINSRHALPLKIINHDKDFYSTVDVLTSIPTTDIKFIETYTSRYSAEYNHNGSKQNHDFLLLTHSFDQFVGTQNGVAYNISNTTFSLDLSQAFSGSYTKEGHTKSLVLPYDNFPSASIDFIKKNHIELHPFYMTIERLMKTINTDESDPYNIHKIQAILDLLSITCAEEKKDLIVDIKIFIEKCILGNKKLDLDILSAQFFMSRRKMQYVLADNGWTYRNLIANTKCRCCNSK